MQTADYKLQFKQQKDSVRGFFLNTIVFYISYMLKNQFIMGTKSKFLMF